MALVSVAKAMMDSMEEEGIWNSESADGNTLQLLWHLLPTRSA